MKKQSKQFNQFGQPLLLTSIATAMLLGPGVSTFAKEKTEVQKVVPAPTWVAEADTDTDDDPTAKLPKPDFSAMQKWYEIVKYEYGDPAVDNKLYIWAKPKVAKRPNPGGFYMEFRDKDGALVGYSQPIRDFYALSEVGKVVKTYCDTPTEVEFEKVVTATVARVKQ